MANLNFTAYDYVPISLRAERSPDPSQFQFSLTGESGKVYRIDASTDLIHWHDEPALGSSFVQNTNTNSVYSFEIYESPKFIRASPFVNKEVCIAQLKAIDLAIKTWAIEARKNSSDVVEETDITPYLKNTVVCPNGGTAFADSYQVTTIADPPTCRRDPVKHKLPP